MTKFIDAEKLKVKIKQQIHILHSSIQSQGDYGQSCQIVAYENILSIIDSLQQEESTEVDIEKEVTHFVSDDKILSRLVHYDDALLIARHFYQLGLNARK